MITTATHLSAAKYTAVIQASVSEWTDYLTTHPNAEHAVEAFMASPVIQLEFQDLGVPADETVQRDYIRRGLLLLHHGIGDTALSFFFKIQTDYSLAAVLMLVHEGVGEHNKEQLNDYMEVPVLTALVLRLCVEIYPLNPEEAFVNVFLNKLCLPHRTSNALVASFQELQQEWENEELLIH